MAEIYPVSLEQAKSVSHAMFCNAFARECEEHNVSFSQREITTAIPPYRVETCLQILSYMIGRMEAAYGFSLIVLFHHMKLESDRDREDALYSLCMQMQGEGVGIQDNYSEAYDHALAILRNENDPDFYWEGTPWMELSYEAWQAGHRPSK